MDNTVFEFVIFLLSLGLLAFICAMIKFAWKIRRINRLTSATDYRKYKH